MNCLCNLCFEYTPRCVARVLEYVLIFKSAGTSLLPSLPDLARLGTKLNGPKALNIGTILVTLPSLFFKAVAAVLQDTALSSCGGGKWLRSRGVLIMPFSMSAACAHVHSSYYPQVFTFPISQAALRSLTAPLARAVSILSPGCTLQ